MFRRTSFLVFLARLAAAVARPVPIARACLVANTPSITVNGTLALLNKTPATSKTAPKTWALFMPVSSLNGGHAEALAEVRSRVSMAKEGFEDPWRWSFGVGTFIHAL